MSKLKHAASVPHSEATIAELRTDRAFAVEYLKSALEELDNPDHRAVGLLALRDVAEAYGGLATAGARRLLSTPSIEPFGSRLGSALARMLAASRAFAEFDGLHLRGFPWRAPIALRHNCARSVTRFTSASGAS